MISSMILKDKKCHIEKKKEKKEMSHCFHFLNRINLARLTQVGEQFK